MMMVITVSRSQVTVGDDEDLTIIVLIRVMSMIDDDDFLLIGLCDQHEVNGYPTIRYYHYGQFVVEYDGARETEDFTMFMEEPPKPLPTEKPPVLPDTDTTPDETGDSSSGKRDEL